MVEFELRRVDEGAEAVADVEGEYESGPAAEPPLARLVWDEGGCEKAFGWGVKTLLSKGPVPIAVRLSSSSSPAHSGVAITSAAVSLESSSSFELLKILSLSLSLSSYSSWLLPGALEGRWGGIPAIRPRRLRLRCASVVCWA